VALIYVLLLGVQLTLCVAHDTQCLAHAKMSNTCLGLARTIYIRCTYGIFGLETIKYTVYKYVYLNTVLASPTHVTRALNTCYLRIEHVTRALNTCFSRIEHMLLSH